MIQLGRVLGGVGHIPTTYIQPSGAGSKSNSNELHYIWVICDCHSNFMHQNEKIAILFLLSFLTLTTSMKIYISKHLSALFKQLGKNMFKFNKCQLS